jgi:hypothetical protein
MWIQIRSFIFYFFRAILLKFICERILEVFLSRTCRLDVYGILEFDGARPGSMRIEEPQGRSSRPSTYEFSSFFPFLFLLLLLLLDHMPFRTTRPGSKV